MISKANGTAHMFGEPWDRQPKRRCVELAARDGSHVVLMAASPPFVRVSV
jgi:hypothetical protein